MQDTDSLKPIARIVAVGISVLLGAVPDARAVLATDQGIVFRCNPASAGPVLDGVLGYLQGLGISPGLLKVSRDGSSSDFSVSLAGADPSAGTLDLIDRKDIDVREELVVLPAMKRNATRTVLTVSKKEIALALLTPGRATVFEGAACSVEAIVDHVGVRQNIVSWAELLDWRWPNGGVATWNTKYWKKGSLRKDALLDPALRDAFSNQSKYGIGCYTASKMVVVQGVLDYYARVKNDPKTAALVRARLLTDGEPLVHVEPGAMWSFEADAEPADLQRPGKLLQLVFGVPARHFVPGDWSYFLNTDPATYAKTGYEGSNAIYLGRGRFDDYYNDNLHSYTYMQKLDEVYQWRNQVFSRSRDVAKIRPLSAGERQKLERPPEQGGLQMPYRAVPYLFGWQPLPDLDASPDQVVVRSR